MDRDYDLIVVGAGAAGLSAAQYGSRAGLRVLVVEEMAAGGQALLIDRLENYPGLVQTASGYEFSEAMRAQAEAFGALFATATASSLLKREGGFELETSEGPLSAPAVILATGAKHRHLGVPGEERLAGRGVSYCATCDGPFFKGRPMVVVGGGDSACDEASYLSKLSDRILMVHRKDRFRAQPALARRVLDNPSIRASFRSAVAEIRGEGKVESALIERVDTGERSEVEAAAVFIFVGSVPQTALAPGAAKDEAGYLLTDASMATSEPGLFAAGDVRATPFRQVVTACADGAVAAHAAAKYIDELRGSAYA